MKPLLALLVLVSAAVTSQTAQAARPNFVFFLVDDLGWADISPNNPNTFYETPNVAQLAADGMRFTDGYAANPVCSPRRYSIMTGKYPSRVDATNFFSGARAGRFKPAPLHNRMDLSETTLAESLQQAGYRTAFLGKWHLGPTEEFWPANQGFEFNFGGHVRGAPRSYFSPYSNPRLKDGPKGEHLTARLADDAVGVIEKLKDDPFLVGQRHFVAIDCCNPLAASRLTASRRRRRVPDAPTPSACR